MPLPVLKIEDPNRGTPRQPVPLRFAYFVTGLSPRVFLGLLATRQEGRYEYLTAYEFAEGAEPRQVRPDMYQEILASLREEEPDDKALIEQLPASHFVWSDKLAEAFSQFIRDYLDDETANQAGMQLLWNPTLNQTEALLEECVDLSSLAESTEIAGPQEQGYLFRRSKAGPWEITFEGRPCPPCADRRGLHYLKHLLQNPQNPQNPRKTLSAIELSAAVQNPVLSAAQQARADIASSLITKASDLEGNEDAKTSDFSSTDGGDAGYVFDNAAKIAYKAEIRLLREQEDDARDFGDVELVEEISEKIEFLSKQLREGVRPDGGLRRDKSTSKRAYDAVHTAIDRAIDYLKEHCPDLGQHLDDSIHYERSDGWCYRPPTEISWRF